MSLWGLGKLPQVFILASSCYFVGNKIPYDNKTKDTLHFSPLQPILHFPPKALTPAIGNLLFISYAPPNSSYALM